MELVQSDLNIEVTLILNLAGRWVDRLGGSKQEAAVQNNRTLETKYKFSKESMIGSI